MRKEDFLLQLRQNLAGLPKDEIEERLGFYSEMIDDRMEDGLSEEEAVKQIGSIDEIVSQTVADVPLTKLVKEKIKPQKRLKAWEIILLVLGSPIWLSVLIAVFAVVLSLYICVWTVIISLWAVFASFIACALSFMVVGVFLAVSDQVLPGIAMIGIGLVCAGLGILLFYGCKWATKGLLWLTKKLAYWTKNGFMKKGAAQ